MIQCVMASASTQTQYPQVRLSPEDAAAPWAGSLLEKGRQGAARAAARLGLECDDPVTLVSFSSEAKFREHLGVRPIEIVAVTVADKGEIVILQPALFGLSEREQIQVLTHEMAHFIVARRVKGELPAWIHEGLAMLAAEEYEREDSWRVSLAAATGKMISLARLDTQVAMGGSAQELAYAESLSATRFLINENWAEASRGGKDPAPLARALADAKEGVAWHARLWDPDYRDRLQSRWVHSLRTFGRWISILSGSGILWSAITLLFLLAYWRKRRMKQIAQKQMEKEEAEYPEIVEPWTSEPEGWEEEE